jgi:phosphohistidine phosphatase
LVKVLLVLRHAKSSWDDSRLADHERALNARGERDAPRVGQLLRDERLIPDVIISSDAVRARMTAEAVADAAGYTSAIQFDPRLYAAAPADIVTVLQSTPKASTRMAMIVGHNPGLEELVAQLTGEPHHFPTAALAHIVLPIDRWRDLKLTTRGALAGLWRPKEL